VPALTDELAYHSHFTIAPAGTASVLRT
jgi:hypothetical protein